MCAAAGIENVPTLTAVLLSSSDARLPLSCLLPVLMRLLLLDGRTAPLTGRWGTPVGDPSGEPVMVSRWCIGCEKECCWSATRAQRRRGRVSRSLKDAEAVISRDTFFFFFFLFGEACDLALCGERRRKVSLLSAGRRKWQKDGVGRADRWSNRGKD